ncbi:MAG: hypothetical protein QOE90_193 [Thermoplasmata archaeon]|nr:hypothetical protein [Thermoplasmata archaeon]
MDERALELETRRRLYAYVRAHPGSYLREIQRGVAMSMGALEYHLGHLERAGLLRVETQENKRYFAADVAAADARLFTILRQAIPRCIVIALLESGPASHQDLMLATGLRSSTLSYHARKLADAGLVARERAGRETRYRLAEADRVARLLVEYRASFVDRVVDAFVEGFDAIGRDGPRG